MVSNQPTKLAVGLLTLLGLGTLPSHCSATSTTSQPVVTVPTPPATSLMIAGFTFVDNQNGQGGYVISSNGTQHLSKYQYQLVRSPSLQIDTKPLSLSDKDLKELVVERLLKLFDMAPGGLPVEKGFRPLLREHLLLRMSEACPEQEHIQVSVETRPRPTLAFTTQSASDYLAHLVVPRSYLIQGSSEMSEAHEKLLRNGLGVNTTLMSPYTGFDFAFLAAAITGCGVSWLVLRKALHNHQASIRGFSCERSEESKEQKTEDTNA